MEEDDDPMDKLSSSSSKSRCLCDNDRLLRERDRDLENVRESIALACGEMDL